MRRWVPVEATRVDRWLWSVRLYPTRSLAIQACRGGRVRVNGVRAKPASTVTVGDTITVRLGARERVVEVVRVINRRVGAAEAAACYADRSPAPARDAAPQAARRERGAGRPTKRERRQLDRARGRRGD